jgi:DNA-binding beta-propeller fold protein YncE
MQQTHLLRVAFAILLATLCSHATGVNKYEVWAIDQSNTAGKTYGGTLYVWDGHDLEQKNKAAGAQPIEVVDLSEGASALCVAKTGFNPVRPHMLFFNSEHTHAVISFVASGHVLIMNALNKEPIDCLRMSPGAGGAIQAHGAVPSPDGTYIAVANQNGKLLERINTDYATNTFTHDPAATLNLATCTTPNGAACEDVALRPDNAPICPVLAPTSEHVFVTLRGGGLFVVDGKSTPMGIVGEYDRDTVHPNGCGGVLAGGKMYLNSGGGTPTNLYEADLYAFPLTGYSSLNPPNFPAPRVVFSEDVDHADGHGGTVTGNGRYVWVADRGRNLILVSEVATDTLAGRFSLDSVLSPDPAPDLLATSPNGSHVMMSLRGPNPLSGDPHVSTGAKPGVGVLKVLAGGRSGAFESIIPVSNIVDGVERADVHALAIRIR